MTIEKTLILFTPDFLSNISYSDDYLLEHTHEGMFAVLHIMGLDVIKREGGFKLTKVYRNMSREIAEKHFQEHKDDDFFEDLIKFITTGKCYIVALQGENAIEKIGAFISLIESGPYTGNGGIHDLMHSSNSAEIADQQIVLHFGENK